MEKVSQNYDPVALTRILQSLERRIDALQQPKLRRIKSVAADAAQNLQVNEPGYVLDDSQNVDFVFRAEDGRLYRFSGQASAVAASSSSPAGVFVLKSGDTMTGALVIDGSADGIQLRVQGHSTQTNSLLVLEDSAGNDQVTVSNDGAVVINEEGNDADFRVESDGDANALYVDASANTVQVGSAATSESGKFYVNGKTVVEGELIARDGRSVLGYALMGA